MNQTYKKILDIKFLPRIIKILIIMGINWTFQSLLYMDKTEKLFKLFIDFIGILIFLTILNHYISFFSALVLATLISHTFNWIFNGHIFALLKTFGTIKTKPDTFISYMDNLKKRSSKEDSILLVATFGSLSREKLKETSDLDVRIIREKGFINGLRGSGFVLKERSMAFFRRFPLDIYLLDDFNGFLKLDENGTILYKDNVNSIAKIE